jgi:hypothetical protein
VAGRCQNVKFPRVLGVLNYEMSSSDRPDTTYMLERGYAVCVAKPRYCRTVYSLSGVSDRRAHGVAPLRKQAALRPGDED